MPAIRSVEDRSKRTEDTMKRIAAIAAVVCAVVAIVAPTANAGNAGKSGTRQLRVHAQPSIAYQQGGTTLWRAGSRIMY